MPKLYSITYIPTQIKNRLQKITNKVLCVHVCLPLWDWVRPGKSAAPGADVERLQILRDLHSDKVSNASLVQECHTLVVEALLAYSRGKPKEHGEEKKAEPEDSVTDEDEHPVPKKKKKPSYPVKPYGMLASWCSEHFKQVPSTVFAATLATLYPFVAMEKHGT